MQIEFLDVWGTNPDPDPDIKLQAETDIRNGVHKRLGDVMQELVDGDFRGFVAWETETLRVAGVDVDLNYQLAYPDRQLVKDAVRYVLTVALGEISLQNAFRLLENKLSLFCWAEGREGKKEYGGRGSARVQVNNNYLEEFSYNGTINLGEVDVMMRGGTTLGKREDEKAMRKQTKRLRQMAYCIAHELGHIMHMVLNPRHYIALGDLISAKEIYKVDCQTDADLQVLQGKVNDSLKSKGQNMFSTIPTRKQIRLAWGFNKEEKWIWGEDTMRRLWFSAIAKDNVSAYAIQNPIEFVAEMFAGVLLGSIKGNPEIRRRLYTQYLQFGGPDIGVIKGKLGGKLSRF